MAMIGNRPEIQRLTNWLWRDSKLFTPLLERIETSDQASRRYAL